MFSLNMDILAHKMCHNQIFKHSNIQIFKYLNIQIFKYSNIQIFKYIRHTLVCVCTCTSNGHFQESMAGVVPAQHEFNHQCFPLFRFLSFSQPMKRLPGAQPRVLSL